nr:hypothetical protein [Streptomyces sp. AA0539]
MATGLRSGVTTGVTTGPGVTVTDPPTDGMTAGTIGAGAVPVVASAATIGGMTGVAVEAATAGVMTGAVAAVAGSGAMTEGSGVRRRGSCRSPMTSPGPRSILRCARS